MSEPTFGIEPAAEGEWFWFEHNCLNNIRRRWDLYPNPVIGRKTTWTIVQAEPLSVTPSIHCLECGTHGFITDGKWVSA